MTVERDDEVRSVLVSRIFGLLGLAQRAGKLAVGTTAVRSMTARPRPTVMILARDTSEGQKEKLARLVNEKRLIDDLVDRDELARAFGRNELTVVAVQDSGFVKGIMKIVAEINDDPGHSGSAER
jgi:ribosomal protein L7Ae-like RNA K-turn-binding protein